MTKRYAIVRVDKKCPAYENINLCDEENTTCEDCKVNENYGDTKEQLIKKIEQGLEIGLKKIFNDRFDVKYYERARENLLKIAKEIVEFLGVE